VTRAARRIPGVVVRPLLAATAVALAAWLVWELRSLIVPVCVGSLLAYICRPLVARLERRWIPRGLAVGLLLLMLGGVALVGLNSIRAVMPGESEALALRVRALHALYGHYQGVMGLDSSWSRGNHLYGFLHRDLDPLLDRLSGMLALTPEERGPWIASREPGTEAAARWDRLIEYDRANTVALDRRARRTGRAGPAETGESPAGPATARAGTSPDGLGVTLSAWMVAPLVFLFLLWDTGELKRGLLRAVPNRLFEPALAVLADVDQALGDYVRGLFLESCAFGLTVVVFLVLVGVPMKWAITIGILTGAGNVIPYMGFAAALLGGMAYALLAEGVHPLLPWVTDETFALWVVVAAALAQLCKSFIYEPVVLGGAVNLHPLVVVLGVVGGAILFGPAGMLLTLPTITVARVVVTSTAKHLTAYGVI
jgi:predicted PurR-regulated permease PerM